MSTEEAGVVVSLVVNCTLVEISLSAFFSLYFGILFIVVGTLILWRVGGFDANPFEAVKAGKTRQNQLTLFACLIIFSGLAPCCKVVAHHLTELLLF